MGGLKMNLLLKLLSPVLPSTLYVAGMLVSPFAIAQDVSAKRLAPAATPSPNGSASRKPPAITAQVKRTPPVWEVLGQLQTPESVYFDPASKMIFVSNINGSPTAKDGNGWIGILHVTKDGSGPDGVEKMIEGLNAPKGLRAAAGTLWVTDIDEVVMIDIGTRKISQRIKIPEAKFLNDLAIDDKGRIYVSDTVNSAIYVIEEGKPSLFVAGPEFQSPNGLLFHSGKLYVAAWGLVTDPETFASKEFGHVYAIDVKSRKFKNVTKKPLGHLDGLERTKNGHFLVSDWQAGKVYRLDDKGRTSLIAEGIKNAADLGLKENVILVPAMSGNSLSAYLFK